MNKRGSIILWILLFYILFMCGVFAVNAERKALAEDIKTGKLTLTSQAKQMIEKGDVYLKKAGAINVDVVLEGDLYRAFIAKVWFERARLEMEIDKSCEIR